VFDFKLQLFSLFFSSSLKIRLSFQCLILVFLDKLSKKTWLKIPVKSDSSSEYQEWTLLNFITKNNLKATFLFRCFRRSCRNGVHRFGAKSRFNYLHHLAILLITIDRSFWELFGRCGPKGPSAKKWSLDNLFHMNIEIKTKQVLFINRPGQTSKYFLWSRSTPFSLPQESAINVVPTCHQ